jgi:hypothetical protein
MAANGGSQIERSGWIREASGRSQRTWWSFWGVALERGRHLFVRQQGRIVEEVESKLRGEDETVLLARGERSGSRI